ncbi:hypothetical protein BDZ89DRAFT_1070551 [Hymenopellis radicata]|nr:hypothetical protein BDZ89DRAFT_1070551 [Hymenopellis radicata]
MLGVYRRIIPVYPGLCCRLSTRTAPHISAAVKEVLVANYGKDRYPTREQLEKMSLEVGQSYDRLYNWYVKRREKERRTLETEQIESHPLLESARPRIPAVVIRALEARYNDNYYPTRDELEQMSQELGESYNRIYNWFYKRREKERQMVKAAGIESHPLLEHLRPRFSTAVTAALEAKYVKHRYPTYEELEKMSQKLGEGHVRVYAWFHKRRLTERKLMKSTGMEEQPGEFRVAPNRLDLRPYWPRLEVMFRQDLYPTVAKIKLLAEELAVPWFSIVKWFTYRRHKERALRDKAGLETGEFERIGLKLRAKAKPLQQFLKRTRNLRPSQRQLRELASRIDEPVPVVQRWFTSRARKRARLNKKDP